MTLLQIPAAPMTGRPPLGARTLAAAAGLGGVLAAGIALSVGHLVAAFVGPSASPLFAVGGTFIDLTPEWLKSFAIQTFGTNDKLVLLGGIVAVLVVAAFAVGLIGARRPRLAVTAILALGVVGAAAAVLRPGGSPLAVTPALLGSVAGMVALVLLERQVRGAAVPTMAPVATRSSADSSAGSASPSSASLASPASPAARFVSRRRLLASGAAAGILIALSGGLGAVLGGRRSSVAGGPAIPAPLEPLAAVPSGADLAVAGVAPFLTPNDEFYRVDTALQVPAIDPDAWRLRIHGMVDREVTLTLAELLQYPTIERDITLTCVSNEVGGQYAGNARWIGVPLATVLEAAGVQAGADQIVSRSIDGMSIGTPTAVALDGRDAMLAVSMNGQPLPAAHGYPVRMIVPGLYGYVSATKWLVDLELTTFDAYDPYWVQRGWAKLGPIKTMSRIDAPKPLARIPAGRTAIAGVAWAQHRGVQRVEVRVDGGAWSDARLATVDTLDTWRQWVFEWDATSGNHTLEVRATDGSGETQPELRADPFPDGAAGWHSVVVTVT